MNLNQLKANKAGIIEHLLLVAILASTAVLFVHNELLWRWDNLLYDTQLSMWSRDVPDDIIIIAIDDESLNQLGRWPWPRSTHASLINRIDRESPRVIGLDIIFNEPELDYPLHDVLLARAMKASGKVVLPVFMSRQSSNSTPIEALPLPEFTNNAAALGHVSIDISNDGIARKVYLKEGIGKPHWPHYSLAILETSNTSINHTFNINGKTDREDTNTQAYSALQWYRESPYLIPYAGPPGHFRHIGYSQVLSGNYPPNLFKDKIVLVGATAEGMGDAMPTPLSGDNGKMPGVEIIANVIDAVRNQLSISQPGQQALLVIVFIMVALPGLVYPYLNPGNTLLALAGILLATLSGVALLLWFAGIWIPVATILLFQFLSYPLWSWRRLVLAMRHINTELDQLTQRQKKLSMHKQRHIADEIRFVSQFVPIRGWVIQTMQGDSLAQDGSAPAYNLAEIKARGWSTDGYRYWSRISYMGEQCRLGLSLGTDAVVGENELKLLDSLARPVEQDDHSQHVTTRKNGTGYVLDEKIKQVQQVGNEYEQLRRVIDDGLSGMADGVLICNNRGQVLISNPRARWYLAEDDNASIDGQSLTSLLGTLQPKDGNSWVQLLRNVLYRHQHAITEARHEHGRELMIQLSPLLIDDEGFIVNISDISMLKASEQKRTETLNFLSHDLRSPLSSMIALIELARNKDNIKDVSLMLDDIEANTRKTLHLAEQFLQLSRANTTEKIRFHDTDINSVALNAMDQLWGLSSKLGVNIEFTTDQDEVWTLAEPDLLERAIINLLSNALKHSTEGGSVQLGISQHGNTIHCCVTDHGSGIELDELPHLFDMFKRTRGSGVEKKQGVGLGLAFVDAVAKRHSGQVDVESQPGKGASFCLKLPLVKPESSV